MAKDFEGKVKVVSADLSESVDTAGGLGIMAIPQLIFYKDGKEVHRIMGAVPETKIVDALKEYLGA